MTTLSTPSHFTVSLTLEPHHRAEQFRKYHPSPPKAKQVYLNTLAIYAARFYLECLGYELDLSASDGLNPVQQMLLCTAALAVKDHGQLECVPVVGNVEEVEIAPELHQDRTAYVVIHIDDSLRTASLLGFVTQAAERVLLSQLQPMENLPELLRPTVSQQISEQVSAQVSEQITQLGQWLQNLTNGGWQALDSLVNPRAMAFRAQAVNDNLVARCKRISLNDQDLTLAVGLLPTADAQTEIQVQVYATEEQTYLPPQLKLSVLDANNQEVMQAEARATEAIQLKFIGHPGEEFSLKLTLQDTSFAERFMI